MEYLREILKYNIANYGVKELKTGTEVESFNFDEIKVMKELSEGLIPLTVKIGGVEARNDIIHCLSINVDKILAPMVESIYALKNFIEVVEDIQKDYKPKLAINIETYTAYNRLTDMFESSLLNKIDSITIGRSDLSASMNCKIDDVKVSSVVNDIINICKQYNKPVSIGGQIDMLTDADNTKSDYINTRHIMVNNDSNIHCNIREALRFEMKIYSYLMDVFPERKMFYDKRLTTTCERFYKS